MKRIATILCLTVFIHSLMAQSPEWIQKQQRNLKFPNSNYLTGYAENKNQQGEAEDVFLQKMKSYAQTDLVQGVQTTIESASTLNTREENSNFSQLFMLSSVSSSGMTIAGLAFETHYDKKAKTGYALAYADRGKVIANYKNKLSQLKTQCNQKLEQAKAAFGNSAAQLKQLNSCLPLFREAEEAQSLLYALNPSITESEMMLTAFSQLKTEVETLKAKLQTNVAPNISEAARMLAFILADQMTDDIKQVRLLNLSYQDTRMGSSFSRRFSKELEQQLQSEAKVSVVSDVTDPAQGQVPNFITGTYWEDGNALKIIVVLKNQQTNKTLASAETKLEINWLTQNNLNYKPENFQEAYSNMKAFKTDEVTGGGLIADIWTNKGDENLIYSEGDKMKLFVRVNLECYIRVIYHLADGSRALLVDNYYVSSDKVNMVYELPYEFECAEPFGIETLQLNAQTKEFEKLNVTNQDGYEFISDGLDKILVSTRGMKKVTTDVLKAEKRVVVTTMKN